MSVTTSSETDKDSGIATRPISELLVDVHVYRIPEEEWLTERHLARKQALDTAISAGFIRILPELTLRDVRLEVGRQLGFDTIPPDFVFLRGIGRNFARVRAKQEKQMKAKCFVPPLADEPEIYLLEDPGSDRIRSQGLGQVHQDHALSLSPPGIQERESSLDSSEARITEESSASRRNSSRKDTTMVPISSEGSIGTLDKRKSRIPRPSWTKKLRAVKVDDFQFKTAPVDTAAIPPDTPAPVSTPGSGKRYKRRKRSARSAKGSSRRGGGGSRPRKRPTSGARKSTSRFPAVVSVLPSGAPQGRHAGRWQTGQESYVIRDLEIKELSGGKSRTVSTIQSLESGQSISIQLQGEQDDEEVDGRKKRFGKGEERRSRAVAVDDLALWWLHPPPDGFAGAARFNPSGHYLPRILRTLRLRRRQAEIIREDLRHYVHFLREKSSSQCPPAEDLWKRKWLEEKRDTQLLRDHLLRLEKDLRSARASSMSPERTQMAPEIGGHPPLPCNKSNYKMSVTRLVNDIEGISRRVAATKARLSAETQLKSLVEEEAKLLRAEMVDRKIDASVTRSQLAAARSIPCLH